MRTSENAFDATSATSVALQKRAVDLLGMAPFDPEVVDGLQVLRYNASKAYIPHVDFLDDNGGGHDYDSARQGVAPQHAPERDLVGDTSWMYTRILPITLCNTCLKYCCAGSNRFATVFFYLSDVEEGGETVRAQQPLKPTRPPHATRTRTLAERPCA